MQVITTIAANHWHEQFSFEQQQTAIHALEQGQIVLLPNLNFILDTNELTYLDPNTVSGKTKNISYDIRTQQMKGYHPQLKNPAQLKVLLNRYADYSRCLVELLFPHYTTYLIQARTSLRPVEIAGRKPASYRKDDTRLHVDAFPSNPNQGQRLLRVFTNINVQGKPRVWRVGEPFLDVVKRFLPIVPKPLPKAIRKLMQATKITKSYRTDYDHYMLHIHDLMKADLDYQTEVAQQTIEIMPGMTWIVYTDQVSHAAMSGQHMLEQTFILPIQAMQSPEMAPKCQLEKVINGLSS